MEFYLALPLLSFLVREIRTLTAMVLLALGVHLILAYASPTDLVFDKVSVALVHLPGVLIEFLLGAVAWFVVSKSPGQLKRTAMLVTGIVLWLLLAYVFSKVNNGGVGGEQAFAANPLLRGNVGLFASVTYALIVAAWVGWVKDAPSWIHQVAITLGNLSFGLYLFHNAALIVVKALTQIQTGPLFVLYCFVLTALVSWLLHVVCERPLRNFGRSWAARNQY